LFSSLLLPPPPTCLITFALVFPCVTIVGLFCFDSRGGGLDIDGNRKGSLPHIHTFFLSVVRRGVFLVPPFLFHLFFLCSPRLLSFFLFLSFFFRRAAFLRPSCFAFTCFPLLFGRKSSDAWLDIAFVVEICCPCRSSRVLLLLRPFSLFEHQETCLFVMIGACFFFPHVHSAWVDTRNFNMIEWLNTLSSVPFVPHPFPPIT